MIVNTDGILLAGKPKRGDILLDGKGEPIATVLGVYQRSGVRRVKVASLKHGHTYMVGQRWQDWKTWMDESGARILRPDSEEGDAPCG